MVQCQNTLLFYSSPIIGHLVSMVELAKFVLKHHPSFSIIFFLATPPPPPPEQLQITTRATAFTTSYIETISSTTPSITFHHLEPIISPCMEDDSPFNLARINNQALHNALQDLIPTHTRSIKAFVVDFFCNPSFEVIQSFNIPVYYFWTTSASGLTLLLHLPYLDRYEPFELDDVIQVPDMPPIPWRDAPPPLALNSSKQSFDDFMTTSINMARNSKGIILNTFVDLEPRALKVLSSGICTPNVPTVPIFSVGPFIGTKVDSPNECLVWLNSQPSKSVVLLSFGSMGLFSLTQLKEMAEGLEASGHRFLWVVRNPSKVDGDEASLDELLPKGFLKRTKDRGLVVKSWITQKEVLSHESVGGFVTHCGWNSVLEAICGGVPMIGWPLYAEQRMNRVFLVEEMKVALPLDMLEDGFVESSELGSRIRELMDPNSVRGEMVRKRVMLMHNHTIDSMCETGSSPTNLDKLVQSWFG